MCFLSSNYVALVFPGGSDCKESACNAGDPHLIPGSGRSPGEGNDSPLQCSCQENPMERVAWRATVHGGCKESDTTEQRTHIYHVPLAAQVLSEYLYWSSE